MTMMNASTAPTAMMSAPADSMISTIQSMASRTHSCALSIGQDYRAESTVPTTKTQTTLRRPP